MCRSTRLVFAFEQSMDSYVQIPYLTANQTEQDPTTAAKNWRLQFVPVFAGGYLYI